MGKAIGQPVRAFLPVAMPARAPADQHRPDVAELWRQALHVMGTYSVPILTCASIGFAGAGVLGALVNTALTLVVYFQTGGIFSSYTNTIYAQLLVESIIGTFALSLARGAVTWIALRTDLSRPVTLRDALRASGTRWHTLLLSSVLYGTLITIGIAGLTLLLRQLRLDVTNVGRVNTDFDSLMRITTVQAINALTPDPGAPFNELVTYARYLLRRFSTSYYWLYASQYGLDGIPLRIWLIGIGSVGLMGAVGVVLRLRTAAIMSFPRSNQLFALYESMRIGVRYFGYIASHIAVVWFTGIVTNILFIIIPIALTQYLFVPLMVRSINQLWPYPVSSLLFALSTALVGMLLMAFSTVYDARLYRNIAVVVSDDDQDGHVLSGEARGLPG